MIISTSFSPSSSLSLPHLHQHHRNSHRRNSHRISIVSNSSFQNPPPPNTTTSSAIIIGGGLAGLAAATHLHSTATPFILLESYDAVGGRVRTDLVDGFILDRGFQIFITAYPEARNLLDYPSLNLHKFYSGARIFYNGGFHTVADPLRHFPDSIASLFNPIGTLFDKLLIGYARVRVLGKSDQEIFTSDEVPVIDLLRNLGFSNLIIDSFFRPFFGGIFFDNDLETSSRLFDFIFKCLALGDNTIPENGIGEIPNQLASKLPRDCIRLNSKVVSVEVDEDKKGVNVRLENGDELRTEIGVILAVELPQLENILAGNLLTNIKNVGYDNRKPGLSTVCLYFTSDRDKIPSSDPVLYLNGSGRGIVNNMFFATNVVPSYGPAVKSLISVSLIGFFNDVSDDELIDRVVRELSEWFSETVVRGWKHLRTYRVRFAQPNQSPPTDLMKSPRVGPGLGLYLCGNYQTSATSDGALVSGKRAVEALLEDRGISPTL